MEEAGDRVSCIEDMALSQGAAGCVLVVIDVEGVIDPAV